MSGEEGMAMLAPHEPYGSLAAPSLYPTLHPVPRETTPGHTGGLTLTWRDLSVRVTKKREGLLPCWGPKPQSTQILDQVSGIARPGRLMAIMGASGAGKTTLLATISQRIKGEMSGEILVDGEHVGRDELRRMSGFVPQQDLAVETLTVREHINFMSRLKISRRASPAERHRWAQSLLDELGLVKCENTRLSALSGGERKRLALAVQLLTDPPLLFCDEPTTGLDSYSARAVVEKLRDLSASRGMAVVCTIHQPASGLFDLFHDLLLLAAGRLAYQGETSAAHAYFANLGLACPATYNPAEFYVTQLAVRPGLEARSTEQLTWLCDQFAASPEATRLREQLSDTSLTGGHYSTRVDGNLSQHQTSGKGPSWYTQLYWLMWRGALDERRNKAVLVTRMLAFMFVGLVISVPFMGTQPSQQAGIQNLQGLFYLIVVETIFTFAYSVFNTFPHEMPVLLREIGDSLYRPGPYYLSKMILLVPRCIVTPFCYTLLIFCVVGLEGGVLGFLTLCTPVILCAISATAYGCMLSAMFESVSTASLLSVPLDFVCLTCSGLFLKISSMPVYISWIRYISQFYYANEAVSILQWQQVTTIDCWDIPDAPCLHSGQEVLEKYGFIPSNLPKDLVGLLAIYCVTHTLGFLSLLRRSKRQATY